MTDGEVDPALAPALELAARDDTYPTEEMVRGFLASGEWSRDSFWDLLERRVAAGPDDHAVIDAAGSVTTWGELRERALAFAAALEEMGYAPGDRIGVQLPNWVEFWIAVLGAARAGVRPAFIHPPYRAHEMEYILGLTEAKGLIVPGEHRGTDHVELGRSLQARLPGLRDLISVRDREREGTVRLEDLLREGAGRGVTAPPPAATDLFVLMFTSGTTSRPKGVMHTHANLLNACRRYVRTYGLTPEDRWLVVTPVTHLTAFGIPMLAGALAAGSSLVLQDAWNVSEALRLVERDRVTHFVGAPPMLIDVARSDELSTRDLASLRFMMYAGAPCPIEILRTLAERLGCALAVFYGWTEGLAHTYSRPDDPLEVTSVTVGRTGDGWEWRIVDDAGADVPVGEVGEFWGRGANLSPGYYRQPHILPERFRPDGWFMSGDLMRLGEDGAYTFVARKDDVINRGGQKVDPREIEELLYTHPAVGQAVVVGVPDERLGQRACAYVTPLTGATLTMDEMRAFLEQKGLAKYKWPERLELIGELPMTPTGKIMRYRLRDQAADGGDVPRAGGPDRARTDSPTPGGG